MNSHKTKQKGGKNDMGLYQTLQLEIKQYSLFSIERRMFYSLFRSFLTNIKMIELSIMTQRNHHHR